MKKKHQIFFDLLCNRKNHRTKINKKIYHRESEGGNIGEGGKKKGGAEEEKEGNRGRWKGRGEEEKWGK